MARTTVEVAHERVEGCCPVCNFVTRVRKDLTSEQRRRKIIASTARHIATKSWESKDGPRHVRWKIQHGIVIDKFGISKEIKKIQKILEKEYSSNI